MKTLLSIAFLTLSQWSVGQVKTKGDTLILHKVNYANGKRSAYSWMLQSTGNGRATCWDPQGKIMFDSEISRNHGHHSVHFEHHANKVVSKIEESSAPDAGIQWYRSYFYYDEKGVKTGEHHDSYDDRPSTFIHPTEPYVVPKKEEVPPVMFTSELWLINQTEFDLIVSYTSGALTTSDTITSGDSLQVSALQRPQVFENPGKTTLFRAAPLTKTKRSRKWEYLFQPSGEEKNGDNRMRYYYVIGQKLVPKKGRK